MNFYNSLLNSLSEEPFILGEGLKSHFSVFVPFIGKEKDTLLFELRAKGIRQPGEICFPGGMVEEGETPEQCAVRETVEELGITPDKIHITAQAGCIVSHTDAIIHVFVGTLDVESTSETKPNPQEVAELYPIPSSFFTENKPDIYKVKSFTQTGSFPAKELGLPKKYHNDWSGGSRNIYVYKYGGITIWGLTAAILYNLISLL
ncbi:MAG: CoA pyrophosphatase [Spirochaetia bacterium]|nr:CoA pyrophosphatase [Spirochaetia bacterium]